jgi:dTDP-4-dehydrorhamnose 3,5-epimerase
MSNPAHYREVATPLAGLIVFERIALGDERGSFEHVFAPEAFLAWGIARPIAQVNISTTRIKGAVRGLHFQRPPHGEDKIVSCIEGSVFDVAVDLREASPTFLHWHGQVLSAENRLSMLIPNGFAHGFQTITNDCRMLYLHTESYVPDADTGINATDPRLGIAWPGPITQRSPRDEAWPPLSPDFRGYAP